MYIINSSGSRIDPCGTPKDMYLAVFCTSHCLEVKLISLRNQLLFFDIRDIAIVVILSSNSIASKKNNFLQRVINFVIKFRFGYIIKSDSSI